MITCRRCLRDLKTHYRCADCGHVNWPYFVFWTAVSAVLLFIAVMARQPGFPRILVLWLGLMFFPYKSLIRSSQTLETLDKIVVLLIGGGGLVAVGILECGPGLMRWLCLGLGMAVIIGTLPKAVKMPAKYLFYPLAALGTMATAAVFLKLVSKIGVSQTLSNIGFFIGDTLRKPAFLIPIIILGLIPSVFVIIRGYEIGHGFGRRMLLFAAGLLALAATLGVIGIWVTAWYTPR